jgi:hypothetical protein
MVRPAVDPYLRLMTNRYAEKLSLLVAGLSIVGALFGTTTASAANGSDLVPSWVGPGPVLANTSGHYEVRVTNIGTRASSVPTTVVIQLPITANSPTVRIMGTVANLSTGCSLAGTKVTCSLASVPRSGGVGVVGFDMTLPVKAGAITFSAAVASANDLNPTNNTAGFTAAQTYTTVPSTAPMTVTVTSCTGTAALTSFYECLPGSTQQHQVTLVGDGSIDFTPSGAPASYSGTWSVSGTQLSMTYTDNGAPIGSFTGQGATSNCWEGRMVFTNSTYVAIYQVCR